ncbi:MAG: protein adenylyltransferase SelO family protein [Bacteriovoracales bacterium]|nr:protein adenylyltransferase SelO family protein [Bacteriovoracales bacterium]
MEALKRPLKKAPLKEKYDSFNQIDGEHPLQEEVEDFCVLYDVRLRPHGKVVYFNFNLAKEMGLISQDHPHKLNKRLEKKLLESFGLVIINEYDLAHRPDAVKKFQKKDKKFMATRYLQLQHPSRKGETSGDGRSIWNGHFESDGVTWDISSCGTGATRLSPATALSNKFFKTGDPSISYGCGQADLLDGVGTALMSEIFHSNGLKTERTLCLIEYSKGSSINVRAGKNLLRPGHFFRYLKQGRHDCLRQIVDYHIDRQISNGEWQLLKGFQRRYDYFLKDMTRTFATISAVFEAEYVFCWLDWDGDNILMDGGIIDYGSVRQFGLYHHEYRYDDIERMSTTLTEQKHKAKYIVKTFAQLVHFLKTKEKKNLNEFSDHPCLGEFDKVFKRVKQDIILKKMGFNESHRSYIFQYQKKLLEDFLQTHFYFESYKSDEGLIKMEDGVTHNAIFCMRDLLRCYPSLLEESPLKFNDFLNLFTSHYAMDEDLKKTAYKAKQAKEWQVYYREIVGKVVQKFNLCPKDLYREMAESARKYNKYARITGDSVVRVAKEFIRYKSKIGDVNETVSLMEQFIENQSFEKTFSLRSVKKGPDHEKFLDKIYKIVINHREGL